MSIKFGDLYDVQCTGHMFNTCGKYVKHIDIVIFTYVRAHICETCLHEHICFTYVYPNISLINFKKRHFGDLYYVHTIVKHNYVSHMLNICAVTTCIWIWFNLLLLRFVDTRSLDYIMNFSYHKIFCREIRGWGRVSLRPYQLIAWGRMSW